MLFRPCPPSGTAIAAFWVPMDLAPDAGLDRQKISRPIGPGLARTTRITTKPGPLRTEPWHGDFGTAMRMSRAGHRRRAAR